MLNTYPSNPWPISSEQLHKGDNEDLQAQINAIKDGTVIDSFGDVETALETKTDNDVIAPEFDAEAGTYAVGDLVMHEGKLYEFTSAHETAGEWDPTEVTETTVGDEIDTVKSGLTNLGFMINPNNSLTNPTDLNDCTETGMYFAINSANKPNNSTYWFFVLVFRCYHDSNGDNSVQIAIGFNNEVSSDVYYRVCSAGTWESWHKLTVAS